jgi:hypothetical protein
MSTDVHQPRCSLDDPTVEGSQEQSPYVMVGAPCSNAQACSGSIVECSIEIVVDSIH